ncbi:MAG: hypothetical protein ACYDD4_09895 [Acidimicrobiales bacterium]
MAGALDMSPGSIPPVVVLRSCRPGDAWHAALRRYKDAPAVSARAYYRDLLATALHHALDAHGTCLRGFVGPWDRWAVVPSSSRGSTLATAAPLRDVAVRVPSLDAGAEIRVQRGEGSCGHVRPAPDAFEVVPADAPARTRVLLLDDTWVTGAHALSAVAALRRTGADVAGMLVLGRSVSPDASPHVARWWLAQRRDAAAHSGCPLHRSACVDTRTAG